MTTKHTPGPWVSTYDEFDDEMHISTQDRVDSHTIAIASVGVGYCGPIESEQQANASLIAAAPDLLVALQRCLNFIEGTEAEFGEEFECGNLARAAIAKAEGRS